jgi:hypothetical protein
MSWSPCNCRTYKFIKEGTRELTFYSYNNMFKICCLRLFNQCYYDDSRNGDDFLSIYYNRLFHYLDFKSIIYKNEIILVHTTEKIKECIYLDDDGTTIIKVKNIDIDEDIIFVNKSKYNEMINHIVNLENLINKNKDKTCSVAKIINLENQINIITKELNKKDELNKRLINTLMLYRYSEFNNTITYDYEEIKKRNKTLNTEFKRVAKLMKLGY